jgi:hypothetical protein
LKLPSKVGAIGIKPERVIRFSPFRRLAVTELTVETANQHQPRLVSPSDIVLTSLSPLFPDRVEFFSRQRWTSQLKPMPGLDLRHVLCPKVSHS